MTELVSDNDNDDPAGICLVLFCRRPSPGHGKQRLALGLGRDQAAAAATHLLAAALEDAQAWPGPVVLSPDRDADTPWARSLLDCDCEVIAQPGGNLGERLNGVDQALRRRGMRHIVYIGSDAPGLDDNYFCAARQQLRLADAVLGPALDGGVTLMAANHAWPPLAELPWGTDRLGDALAGACRAQGWRVARLPPRADVDRAEDLEALVATLRADPRPARRALLRWWDERERRARTGT